MKKKILFIGVIIILIILAIVGISWKAAEEELDIPDNYVMDKENNRLTGEYFTATVLEENEQYTLNLVTNLINQNFEFSYNTDEFILDTSSELFDNAKQGESAGLKNSEAEEKQENIKSISLKLEANTVYEFHFIPKKNGKLKIGKNLFIK